jgi:hypothetical protein
MRQRAGIQGLGHAQSGLADIQAGIEAATLSI